jgi:CheY-like chemotaxis protein
MDHMMPEMDGVEATHAIRALGEDFARLPIVAVTANAVSGMREMFLEHGFNDFLSKPIEVSKLDAMLQRWIPVAKRRLPLDAEENVLEDFEDTETVFSEITGVDTAAGLARVGGIPERYWELLKMFCRDAREALLPLAQAPEDEISLRSFITRVHALKSALSNIGAEDLSQAAAFLEKAGREEDWLRIRTQLPVFREDLTTLKGQIEVFLALAFSGEDKAPVNPEFMETIGHLRQALDDKDFMGIDAALGRLYALPLVGELRAMVSEIADLVLIMEFEEAACKLAAWQEGKT